MKKLLLLSLIIFYLPFITSAQGAWNQKSSMNGGGRSLAVGFSIGNKGYIGTGILSSDFWEWDQATNVWTQKANFGGTGRDGAVGFSIGNKGYIGTGDDGMGYKNDFWEWDQSTNVWTQKTSFGGISRADAIGFSVGTKGYIGTGRDFNGNPFNDFWEWDQATNVWTQKANFPGASRFKAVGFSIATKGYIGTGIRTSPDLIYCNDFWEWNQATNVWTQKANFGGTEREAAIGFSIGNKGFIGTGYTPAHSQDFWEWDQVNNIWIQEANYGGGVIVCATGFSIGKKGYLGTGDDSFGNNNAFWEYTPDSTIQTAFTNATCNGSNSGTATAILNGGTPPFTYSWNTTPAQTSATATGLYAGTYSVFVTGASGVTFSKTVTISQPTVFNTSVTAATTICFGDCATLNVNATGGNGGYTYLWIPGGSTTLSLIVCPTALTEYTVTASNLCGTHTLYTTATVVQCPFSPIKNLRFSCHYQYPPGYNCWGLSWSPPNSSLPDKLVGYNIYRDDSLYLFTKNTGIYYDPCIGSLDATYAGFTNYKMGKFWIHVTAVYDTTHIESIYNDSINDGGCGLIIGINETNIANSITISPNPFSIQTVLRTDNSLHNATLTVDNCFGQTVKQINNISGQTVTLYRDNLPSGLYFLRLTEDNKVFSIEKLLIVDN